MAIEQSKIPSKKKVVANNKAKKIPVPVKKAAIKNSGVTKETRPGLQNLRPFKKGQSGNPNGRPKKIPALDKLMAEVLGEETNGHTAAMHILNALRKKAFKGDIRAAEVLLDRAYGKPKESLKVDQPLNVFMKKVSFR